MIVVPFVSFICIFFHVVYCVYSIFMDFSCALNSHCSGGKVEILLYEFTNVFRAFPSQRYNNFHRGFPCNFYINASTRHETNIKHDRRTFVAGNQAHVDEWREIAR